MTTFFANLAIVAISWLFTAWLLMVAVGVVHAAWIPQLPTIGFSTALLLSLLLVIRGVIAGTGTALVEAVTGGGR